MRIPLAAHYWPDPELHALQILLAVQFSWTAILFPILCRSWRMGVATLASGWVMLLLAAALSAWPPTEVFPCAGYIGVWVTALTFWRGALKRNWLQMMASALIVAFTIGGPIIWYFGSDLTQRAPAPSTWQFGPLLGVLANLAKPPTSGWTLLFLMAGSGFTIRLLRHWRTRPHFAPPGNPDRHFSTGR